MSLVPVGVAVGLPLIVCMCECGVGGSQVSGFAHGWYSCWLSSGACEGWFSHGSDLGHKWQGLHIVLALEGVWHGLYSSDSVGRWKGLHIDGFLAAQHLDFTSRAGSNLRPSKLHPLRPIYSDQAQLRKNRHTIVGIHANNIPTFSQVSCYKMLSCCATKKHNASIPL